MFTGLVQKMGCVVDLRDEGPGKRLTIHSPDLASRAQIGASIAINGCCLTVIETTGENMIFEAGPETLSRTNLSTIQTDSRVNLEPSLAVGDLVGGHFVTGHIDAVGLLDDQIDDQAWSTCWFRVPARLTQQMISKGSVAVDGVSLTLVDVEDDRFSVQLIPHTLTHTTLGNLKIGYQANIETDVLAKYAQKA
ncbi:MAG: riboflavin synthase, partial [Planctomycetales bacterium]